MNNLMQSELGRNYAETYSRDSLTQIASWARDHAYLGLKRRAQEAEEDAYNATSEEQETLCRDHARKLRADADRFASLAHALVAFLPD